MGDPASRAYYDTKTAQGKHHTHALLCPVRRRADVLFAMLRDGTFYEPKPVTAVAEPRRKSRLRPGGSVAGARASCP